MEEPLADMSVPTGAPCKNCTDCTYGFDRAGETSAYGEHDPFPFCYGCGCYDTQHTRVDISGQYGVKDGEITIYWDTIAHLPVTWTSQEWIEDPSLVFVIAEAIRIAYEDPAEFKRRMEEGVKPRRAKRIRTDHMDTRLEDLT